MDPLGDEQLPLFVLEVREADRSGVTEKMVTN
jgi:hypothetical protein